MKYLACIFIFVFSSCHPSYKCTSFCGLSLTQESEWSCQEFDEAMHEAITHLTYQPDGGVQDSRFSDICYRVQGYEVNVRPVEGWINPDTGNQTTGTTSCWNAHIELGNAPPLKGSFAHELAHGIQDCQPKKNPCKTNVLKDGGFFDPMHNCWVEDGIFRSIDLYQGKEE